VDGREDVVVEADDADREDDRGGQEREQGDAVQPEDTPPLDDHGADHVGHDEHGVLEPGEGGEARGDEEDELADGRRLVDRTDTRGDRRQDEGVRDQVGGGERRERERGDEQRVGRAEEGVSTPEPEPAGQAVDGNRGERADEGVLDLDGVVRGRRREPGPDRRGQDRLDDLREVARPAADLEVAVADRTRERRVDVLVRKVARRLVEDGQERVDCRRRGDECGEQEAGPAVAGIDR
jgi:hypothetical protein